MIKLLVVFADLFPDLLHIIVWVSRQVVMRNVLEDAAKHLLVATEMENMHCIWDV